MVGFPWFPIVSSEFSHENQGPRHWYRVAFAWFTACARCAVRWCSRRALMGSRASGASAIRTCGRPVVMWVPSGKHTQNYGKIHHVQWVNPLFLWSFSIATLNYHWVRYGAYMVSIVLYDVIWHSECQLKKKSLKGFELRLEVRSGWGDMTSWRC